MVSDLRLALFQFAPVPGRLEENLALVLQEMNSAEQRGARLLVTPEMGLTGWSLPERADRERLAKEVETVALPALTEAVGRTGVSVVVGGPFGEGNGAPANAAIGLGPGGRRVVYRKIHLFGPERDWWAPGHRVEAPLEVGDVRVGLTICYDAEFPEVPRLARLAGANLLAVLATNMTPYERDQDLVFPTRALENEVPVLLCNRVGTERGWSYFGRSLAAGARGEILGQAGDGQELLVVDVSVPVGAADPDLSYLSRRRPEVYGGIARRHTGPREPGPGPRSMTATDTARSPIRGGVTRG